ncbi:ABC transporter permease subunit [Amycolatopsis cihanbeyliensis]|uniref:ABC-2 type transport system permease protein n=1 Tax=Amycolatopsis cihanbeyliensis TaxID=1128664 RepID=A0A542DHR8_AMYCI|nr:ABC transporter permease subunit [Amycolatopsis cihanbeyliensis]TQJ02586.1 ABC-2 type transport system permease protein [Amycolatopsis cihanbeyliensis]
MTQATAEVGPRTVQTRAPRVPLPRLVRAELRWIFRRPRTLIVLGLFAILPVAVGIGLVLVDSPGDGDGPEGPTGSLLTAAAGNALILPVAMLALTLGLLLPLTAAMAGADALAGESSHGTLRGWLLAPVSRGRLLGVKTIGVAAVVLAAITVLTVIAIITGLVLNGTDSLFTLSGTTLSFPAALGKIAVAVGWAAVQAWAVGAVALAISACTEHPMLVVASVLGGTVVFSVLRMLDALAWLHPFLLTESFMSIADVLRDPIPTANLAEGLLRAGCYIVIALSLAYARIVTKDG